MGLFLFGIAWTFFWVKAVDTLFSARRFLSNLSEHQGYKRLSAFVPGVVFVMVWTLLPSIDDDLYHTDDFVWISGMSALGAALSFVAVKGIHWVTDGFKEETK